MDMGVISINEPKSELQGSGLEPYIDVRIKIEIDDIIKSEQHESDRGGDDQNFQLEHQALVDKIQKDIKSEDWESVNCIGNFDLPKLRTVLEDFKKDNNTEDQSMDFDREIQVKNEISEVKFEFDELFIKQDTEETGSNLAPAKPEQVECSLCSKKFKNKNTLRSHHQWIHADRSAAKLWKCNECSFETKYKKGLKKHLLVHKDPTEIEMFSCEFCSHKSKRKDNLQTHIQLLHSKDRSVRAPTERGKVECSTCGITFKNNENLKRHELVHKDPSTVTLWKCSECNYKTKYKNGVKNHLLLHRDPSEIEMFHCGICGCRCKRKGDLQRHIKLMHTVISAPAQPEKLECDTCGKTFKSRLTLKNHQFMHIDPSTVESWKCSECSYETKRRHNFNLHMLVHKAPSEIQIFFCASCSYSGKRKGDLRKHIQRAHMKDPSKSGPTQQPKLDCSLCGKIFKKKECLKKHQLLHKDRSTVRLWECSECNYKTIHKGGLSKHVIVHKNPSEIRMFNCDFCSYRSKRKGDLQKHVQLHHTAR